MWNIRADQRTTPWTLNGLYGPTAFTVDIWILASATSPPPNRLTRTGFYPFYVHLCTIRLDNEPSRFPTSDQSYAEQEYMKDHHMSMACYKMGNLLVGGHLLRIMWFDISDKRLVGQKAQNKWHRLTLQRWNPR